MNIAKLVNPAKRIKQKYQEDSLEIIEIKIIKGQEGKDFKVDMVAAEYKICQIVTIVNKIQKKIIIDQEDFDKVDVEAENKIDQIVTIVNKIMKKEFIMIYIVVIIT